MIPSTVAFLFTNRCNYICDHCSASASPDHNELISEDLMYEIINQAYFIPSMKLVVFTGGEPTLYLNQLKNGLRFAHNKGFLTRIVTNAWWAQTYEKAYNFISELVSCGLTELNISYDDYHLPYLEKFGGEQNILNAVKAAVEFNLPVSLGIAFETSSKVRTSYLSALFSKAGINGNINYLEDFVAPVGRARSKLPPSSFLASKKSKGCKDAGTTLLFLPNGNACYCCGHSVFTLKDTFVASNIKNEPLHKIIKRIQRNVLVWLLHLEGPEELFRILNIDQTIFCKCEACYYLGTKYKNSLHTLAINKEKIFSKLQERALIQNNLHKIL